MLNFNKNCVKIRKIEKSKIKFTLLKSERFKKN